MANDDFERQFSAPKRRAAKKKRPIVRWEIRSHTLTEIDMVAVSKVSPSIALDLILHSQNYGTTIINEREIQCLENIKRARHEMRKYVHCLGRLISLYPTESEALRQYFVEVTKEYFPCDSQSRPMLFRDVSPVALELPQEAALLPWLVLNSTAPSSFMMENGRMYLENIEKLIQFTPDVEKLYDLATDNSDEKIKIAAIVLILMRAMCSDRSPENIVKIIEKYNGTILSHAARFDAFWMISGIVHLLLTLHRSFHPSLTEFVEKLLETTNYRFGERAQLQRILARWREESVAPINMAGLTGAWVSVSA
jgi:hypothetical protein